MIMCMKPKPFNVLLTAQHRKGLEVLRRQRGLKSEGDVIRQLIERALGSGLPPPEQQAAIKAEAVRRQAAPIKSRLKGEWKAP